MTRSAVTVVVCLLVLAAGCLVHGPVQVKPVDASGPVQVKSPVKAHLVDGSTVVYAGGVTVSGGKLIGSGVRYDLALRESGIIGEVPLTEVVALESFENTTNRELTVLGTTGATAVSIVAGAALLKAIFGSCPTVYADVGGERKLEAELFSYSIAPLFEISDVDRLGASADSSGIVELEVRNEALETHYINALELLQVAHERDELIVPDHRDRVVALSDLSVPAAATDGRGRDILPFVANRDDEVFRTDAAVLASVTGTNLRDSIDLKFPVAPDRNEVALLFRLRNSLLNTVLLYDVMLHGAGARSLDWMSRDLAQIGPALRLGSWYSSAMGMRVEVMENGRFREVAHVGDTGPIAWKDVAVVLPVPRGEQTVRVRLSFPADNWRIDQIRFAGRVRKPEVRTVSFTEVVTRDGTRNLAAERSLAAADGRYLQTSPSQSFFVRFDAGPSSPGVSRTFLLRSSGYYTEWVRGSWVASSSPVTFAPGDESLLAAITKWRDSQSDYEARFDATRIPVR